MSTTNLVHNQRAPQKDHRPRKVRKHRRWSSPATILSLIVLAIAALWAIVPGIFAPHDPYNGVDVALLAPNGEYIFGTDAVGRDLFSRVVYGARQSLLGAVIAVAVGLVLGTLAAMIYWGIATFSGVEAGFFNLPGQGTAFVAASIAFVVDIVFSILVSLVTKPKPDHELVGFVKSVTPKENLTDANEAALPWYQRTVPLGILCLVMVLALNIVFA